MFNSGERVRKDFWLSQKHYFLLFIIVRVHLKTRKVMSATAALIGGAISAGSALLGTHMRNEAQKRESELAYRRAVEQQRLQNSYNSASAQMARLQAAGLNPNLMYESGQQAAAGTQDSKPEYLPAEIQNAAAPMGSVGAEMINSMVGLKDMENKTALAEADVLLKATTANVNLSQIDLNETTAYNMLEMLGLERTKVDQMVAESESRIRINEANYDLFKKQADEILQRIKESEERINLLKSQANLADTQSIVAMALLPSQKELNEMSAYECFQAGLKAREEARVVCSYYYLDFDKFVFEQKKFDDTLSFEAEQNRKNRTLGYWNLGVQAATTVASMTTKGGSLISAFGGTISPFVGHYGSGHVLHGTSVNIPKPYKPSTGSFTPKPRPKRK